MATTTPPDNRPTGRAESLIVRWAALCAVLVVALGAMSLALIAQTHATAAAHQAKAAVQCVNRILAARAATTEADAKAHIEFAKSVNSLLLPASAPPAERARIVAEFRLAVPKYLKILADDQAFRDTHPLGLCK